MYRFNHANCWAGLHKNSISFATAQAYWLVFTVLGTYNFKCRFGSCWGLFYTIKLCGLFLFRSCSNKSSVGYNKGKGENPRVRKSTTHLMAISTYYQIVNLAKSAVPQRRHYRYKIRGTSSSSGRLSSNCCSRWTSTEKRFFFDKFGTILKRKIRIYLTKHQRIVGE